METLKAGDLVKLKSGSPVMTLQMITISRGVRMAKCSWFMENNAHSEIITLDSLVKVDGNF